MNKAKTIAECWDEYSQAMVCQCESCQAHALGAFTAASFALMWNLETISVQANGNRAELEKFLSKNHDECMRLMLHLKEQNSKNPELARH